jgi:asparagine synthase (glutamine-hydrolysing)
MCGISLCYLPDRTRLESVVGSMVAATTHRGPDANGSYVGSVGPRGGLAMGHNRLSIIDLTDHASQPMHSADGRYVMIYNGEVYNYREIARELDAGELPQGSDGDSAVVLASLIKWGPSALQRFNGMWALALLDTMQQTLLISRDRFGKKPLHYFQDGESFYLASEVKAILAATGRRFAVNPRTAIPYLTRGVLDFSDETFFDGIRQFPAASYQLIRLGTGDAPGSRVERYWHHPYERGLTAEAGTVSPAAVRDLLVDSVRLRLRSDVPIGVLLSGGLDSSAILGAVARLGSLDNVNVLSVVSTDPAVNEEPFIDLMAASVGVTPQKVDVSRAPGELLDRLAEATWFNDAPIPGMSSLAHMELMQLAAERGMKVLLTGQGSDEQLGGYNKFFYFYLFSLWKAGAFARAARTVAQFARHSNTLYEFRLSEAMRYIGRRRLSEGTFINERLQTLDTLDLGFQGSYAKREWLDLTRTSVPQLLHGEDRMSMSRSIEMRVPFLDYRLVELLAQVHPSEKFAGGWTKSILRTAIRDLVPREIRYRRDKKGFTIPAEDWMRGELRDRVSAMFASDLRAAQLGFVDAPALRRLYERFAQGRGFVNGRMFFRAYAFETFLRRFDGAIAA